MKRCIDSVFESTYKNFKIFVVDNSTTSKCHEYITLGNVDASYIKMPSNMGFSVANNVGVKQATKANTDYVLLLNQDAVLSATCLQELVCCAQEEKNVGLVTGKIYTYEDKSVLWYAGGYVSWWMAVGKAYGAGKKDTGAFSVRKPVTYATGCCVLIPNEAFYEAGQLSENLFMYYEDLKFCFQLTKKKYRLYYEPKAILYHEAGERFGLNAKPAYYLYFSVRNRALILKPSFYKGYVRLLSVVIAVVKIFQYTCYSNVTERKSKIKSLIMGIIDSYSKTEKVKQRFPHLFNVTKE